MEKKVVHEVRLSKPLMAVAIIAAFGLLAIGLKPVIEATPAFAQSNQVHKISICGNWNGIEGKPFKCAGVNPGGMLQVGK
jgi:hypothetical protein